MTAGRRSPWPLVVTGAVAGLTWAAGLRGWMVELAGDVSAFSWFPTFLLVLLPGTLVGAAFGLAEHRRRVGLPRSRWLPLAPVLFAAALLDPTIFRQFVTQGIGGGALGIALTALAGGYALSGRGPAWWRRTCGLLATLIVLLMLVMASDQQPLGRGPRHVGRAVRRVPGRRALRGERSPSAPTGPCSSLRRGRRSRSAPWSAWPGRRRCARS